jgi:hypothetical protein
MLYYPEFSQKKLNYIDLALFLGILVEIKFFLDEWMKSIFYLLNRILAQQN